jgi:hydroxyacylglutathione hydrolase
MLEDDFTWVIRKALKGHGLAPSEAAALCGLPEAAVLALTRGRFDAEAAARLAPALGLNPVALSGHTDYSPAPLSLNGVTRIDLPFGQERVNAWLIRHNDQTLLIDAGHEPSDLLEKCGAPGLVLITHAHRDHTGAIPALLARGIPVHVPDAAEISETAHTPPPVITQPGDEIGFGGPGQPLPDGNEDEKRRAGHLSLIIRACDLSGHAVPSLGYHILGLDAPVLVTGDALFAGSMGGCQDPARYRHAIARLREVLAPLPDATVLLPGHGPATTLGEERRHNPFPVFS